MDNFEVDPFHIIAINVGRSTISDTNTQVFENTFQVVAVANGYDGPYGVGEFVIHSKHEKPVCICRKERQEASSQNFYALKIADVAGKIVI